MACDYLGVVIVEAEKFACAFGYIAMAGAVESIAAHMVFLIEFVGDGIEIGVVGHGTVERVVEHCHLRHARHEGVYGADAPQMSGVMHRCEVDEALDALLHLGCNDATFLKEVATLHDAMAHGIDLVEALDGPDLVIEEAFEHQCHAFFMRGQVGHDLFFLSVFERYLDESLIQSDALHAALSQHALVGHVIKFVFYA